MHSCPCCTCSYESATITPWFVSGHLLNQVTADLVRAVETGAVTPLRRINPAVPIDLQIVIAKAMSPSLEGRYQTAAELGDDLLARPRAHNVLRDAGME